MTQPASRHRLRAFDLVELPKDINGQPDGVAYETFLDFSEMRSYSSVRNGINGIWSGRFHKLPSEAEAEVFIVLEGNPRVISIREGYFIAPEDVIEDLRAGVPVARNRVMTIDFVLTRPRKSFSGPLHYMGLSHKPPAETLKPAGVRRATREEDALTQLGWTWAYVLRPSVLQVANHKKLRRWAKPHPLDDGAADAAQLAGLFYRTTSNKTLRAQLAMFGKRLGIPVRDQFFVFASAYYLGYLALDHSFALDEDLPPVLKRAARTPAGWRTR